MPCDIEVQVASAIMTDNEKAVEDVEGHRWHCEKIHRCNCSPVIVQKVEPSLGRLRIPRHSLHPPRDRSFREITTEHEKLAVDSGSSPRWILGDHPEDQSRTSLEMRFLPTTQRTLEIARQQKANPARCHRTMVLGLTMMRACFQSDQNRRATTQ
jgi:hypothetical protein